MDWELREEALFLAGTKDGLAMGLSLDGGDAGVAEDEIPEQTAPITGAEFKGAHVALSPPFPHAL